MSELAREEARQAELMRRRNVDHQALPIARDVIGGGDKGHRLCGNGTHAAAGDRRFGSQCQFLTWRDAVDVFHAESRYSKEQLAKALRLMSMEKGSAPW